MGQVNSRQLMYDDITTSTMEARLPGIIDGIFQIRPLYSMMVEKGKIKAAAPEGSHWEVAVRYAKQDQGFKWFGRGDTFDRGTKESLTRLLFDVKNAGTSVVRYWLDDMKNRGRAQIINYVDEVVSNTSDSLADSLAALGIF